VTIAFDAEPTAPLADASSRFRADIIAAMAGFIAFCLLILTKRTALLEPDDSAYRASIIALRHGEILLTNAQYAVLSHLTSVQQWHHMASGYWISEKNPGYPFLAVLFYMAGLLRFAPLFYGAVGATGLFWGANKWLGRPAGALAVGLYLTSGAALTFAWRVTMPSFTDASLIAGGAGWLLWALLSTNERRRRRWIGLLGFACLELAVFIRYTNVLELVAAILVVVAAARPAALNRKLLLTWGASVVVSAAGIALFNSWAYGSPTATGYSAGEITFSLSALWPNVKGMPKEWTTSMPLWILAMIAVVAVIVQYIRRSDRTTRRDLFVVAGLGLGWLGLWLLYLNYTWTATMLGGGHGGPGVGGGATVQVIRFYLPALGLVALIATWVLRKLPRLAALPILAALAVSAVLSFHSMAGASGPGDGGFRGGGQPPAGVTGRPPVDAGQHGPQGDDRFPDHNGDPGGPPPGDHRGPDFGPGDPGTH